MPRLHTTVTLMALLLASALSLTAASDASADSSSSTSDEVPEITKIKGSFTAKNRVFRKLEIDLTDGDLISLQSIVCTGLTVRPSQQGGQGSTIVIDDSIIGEHGIELGGFDYHPFKEITILAANITVGKGRLHPLYIYGDMVKSIFYFRDSHFAAHDTAPFAMFADVKDRSQVYFTNVQFTRDLWPDAGNAASIGFFGDVSNSKIFVTRCLLSITASPAASLGLTTTAIDIKAMIDSRLEVRNSTIFLQNPAVKHFFRLLRRVATASCISFVDSTLTMRCGPLGLPSECAHTQGMSAGFHFKQIAQPPSYFTVNDSSIDMVSDPGTSMFNFDSFQNTDAIINNIKATLVTNESNTREPLFTKIEYGQLAVFAVTNSEIAIPQGTGIYGPFITVPRNFSFFTMNNQWVVKNDVLRPKPDATINAKTACNTVNGNVDKLENLGTQITCNKTAEWVPNTHCSYSKVLYAALGIDSHRSLLPQPPHHEPTDEPSSAPGSSFPYVWVIVPAVLLIALIGAAVGVFYWRTRTQRRRGFLQDGVNEGAPGEHCTTSYETGDVTSISTAPDTDAMVKESAKKKAAPTDSTSLLA